MDTIRDGVKSISYIAVLNYDRFLVAFIIGTSLFAAGYLVSY